MYTIKKTLSLFVCALLLLGLCPALAYQADVDVPFAALQPVLCGNILYARPFTPGGPQPLLAWTIGDAQAKPYCSLPAAPANLPSETPFDDFPPEAKAALYETVGTLFEQDGLLYALNHYSGKMGPVDAQGVHWTDQKIDVAPYFANGSLQVWGGGFAQGGTLFMPLHKPDARPEFNDISLLASDLKTGQTRLIALEQTVAAAPHSPGKLLLLRAVAAGPDAFAWQLALLDIASGAIAPLPMALLAAQPNTEGVGAIGYDAAQERYFYATPAKLMMSQKQAPFVLTALLSFDYMSPNNPGLVLPDGRYAIASGETLAVRQMGGTVDLSQSLTIQTSGRPDAFKQAFLKAHPGAVLFYEEVSLSAADVASRVRNGDPQPDLFTLEVTPGLRALIDKGYAAPFTDEALLAESAKLYPAIRQVIQSPQGAPSAWPAAFYIHTGAIDITQWRKYFGQEAYPATYLQLFDAMLRFTKMQPGPQPDAYFLLDTQWEQLAAIVIRDFIRQYEQPGQALDFNAPVLRQTLKALEDVHALQQATGYQPQEFEGESSGDPRNAPSLVSLYGGGGNPFAVPRAYDAPSHDLLPFTFAAGETPVQAATLHVMVINPNSPNQALAQAYLQTCLSPQPDPQLYYALRPDAATPYLNPDFEQAVQKTRDDLALYSKALQDAESNPDTPVQDKAIYLWRVKMAQEDLNNLDNLRYLIPAQGIAAFRRRAQLIRYFDRSVLLDSGPAQQQLHGLVARYLGGELALDGLLSALTDMARLAAAENK